MLKPNTPKYPMGTQTRDLLNDATACPWYADAYEKYTPNAEIIAQLDKNFTPNHEILLFGGTWCEDTQHLLPHFYKVVDAMVTPPKTKMVFVNLNKESGEGIEKNYSIELVPTFIVLKDGKEIGRVIETVKESIEADLAAILMR